MTKTGLVFFTILILILGLIGFAIFQFVTGSYSLEDNENIDGDFLVLNNYVKVKTPRPEDTLKTPLLVEGQARGNWFFEGSFPIKILGNTGKELGVGIAQAEGEWMTKDFVPFSATIDFVSPSEGDGKIVFIKDNPSGLPENDNKVEMEIKLPKMETMSVKPFWNNGEKFECEKVDKSERVVAKNIETAKTAIYELLKGPNVEEQKTGFTTSIPTGASLESIKIEGGVAYADFDKILDEGVSGSCRVSAIRAQITETLKQFETIKKVIISVEGNVDEALQP